MSGYYIKTKAKSGKYYIIRFSPNGTFDIFEKMNDTDFLIRSLVEIVKNNSRVKMQNIVFNIYVV